VPEAVKVPKAIAPEPTLPPMETAEPAVRVSALLATLASTLPVMVMLPTPEVVIAAKVALLEIRFPVTTALALAARLPRLQI